MWGMVSSVISAKVGDDRRSFQGFSSRIEGDLPNDENPAYCARRNGRDNPDQRPIDPTEQTGSDAKNLDNLSFNVTLLPQMVRTPPKEGQCGEPHAYKRMIDIIGEGTPHIVVSTVAVMLVKQTNAVFYIKTATRCDTCEAYSIFGDIPTDNVDRSMLAKIRKEAIPVLNEPPIDHGDYVLRSKRTSIEQFTASHY
ncbi:hypothetical protein EDD86DRAFT_211274 [Gorgonomyces haynaldii]|nr:hypothetical protein EDD86DRAFT_211274 [Gorgonomyces haynaldii]